ncbi:hypothetical protein LZ30DRAFT_690668 [Colletotrichum cereale]|nr:hypothetical protein LZ30DRAFT_690668 [Colletotrichum cereale]
MERGAKMKLKRHRHPVDWKRLERLLTRRRGGDGVLGSLPSLLGLDAGECRPAARRVCRRNLPAVPTLATEAVGYAVGISDGQPGSQLRYEEFMVTLVCLPSVWVASDHDLFKPQDTLGPQKVNIAKTGGWFVQRLDRVTPHLQLYHPLFTYHNVTEGCLV